MRNPLVRLGTPQLGHPGARGPGAAGPAYERDQASAAAETVALVLDEDSPLPERRADVEELVRRLRGHIMQLSIAVPLHEPAVRRAQQLASVPAPDRYVPSRVHLVQLAEATQEVADIARAYSRSPEVVPSPRGSRRTWKPQINTLRGAVFAVAFVLLVLAASLPRA